MTISSESFQEGDMIPQQYTCDGKGISPQLSWSGFPKETKSFVIVCLDPDSPSGHFIHWLVANISASIDYIGEAQSPTDGTVLDNSADKSGYFGPCPANGEHRYVFSVYALNVERVDGIDKDNYLDMIKPHLIDRASIMGLYKKLTSNSQIQNSK